MRYILILLLWLSACSEEPIRLQPLPDGAVILAFGNSLTYGTGASRDQSYPAVLSDLLGLKVINAGVPGEISAAGQQRLPKLLEQYQPDLVILIHGGNDLLRRLPLAELKQNLIAMITAARQSGAQVMLVAVPQPALILNDADLYAEVAEQAQVPLLKDILSQILSERRLKSDQIHPNAQGYARLAQAIADFLQSSGAVNPQY